ncbi:protein FAR1-RELATED SEQUENCE 5-like [Camellia sinensis]|uniref:protein FAR1-RELATED SEQUENCE 5-like n=1 Tax=Camellia sinensis TaxID=4442 RepID=UPI0010358B0E|nr:protein FAR1-RELATED SEQUENCE 5-like [Camellia sinensis]
MNESWVEPYHGCEAGSSNEEATNMNVEDSGADVKKEMVDDAHGNDMVGDIERAILEQKFDSVEDGEAFYNAYAKAKGFSIQKSRFNTNKEGKVVSRLWLCSREGQRLPIYLDRVVEKSRAPKALIRVGCKAQFRIRYDADASEGGKYVVTHFIADHNHELAEPLCVMYLRSHCRLNSADKSQAMAMRNVGVKTSQIIDYMVNQSGSYENVSFVHSKSQGDYAKFGNVLIFDSTYRTNAYKKPFVMLAGVTSHFRTTIFACVLLANETIETYTWVLETFMEAMGNKASVSVLTDGNKAMREAIRRVFPDARHQLCNWRLGKNTVSNVHISGFAHAFKQCMDMEMDETKFEHGWTTMVEKFGLQTNSWVLETYEKLHMWAEAYMRGHFFAGTKSTQHSECMNAYFNPFLQHKLKLYEFVRHYDRALARIRYNEAGDDAETNNTFPTARYGILSSSYNEMCFYASQSTEGFKEARDACLPLTSRMKELYERNLNDGNGDKGKHSFPRQFGVKDPDAVKTKGNPGRASSNCRRLRKCGNCKCIGHTKRTCPKVRFSRTVGTNIDVDTPHITDCEYNAESLPVHCKGGSKYTAH